MRLLHTSDWHLGRSLHRADLRAAQSAFLDHLVDVARAEKVDAVLVAGDVYDRAVPPVDAIELCEDALLRLHDTGARIVLISGNHDSARRLGFGSGLLEKAGVHLRTRPGALARPVVLEDPHGPVAVYGVPYLEPDAVRAELPAGQDEIPRGHAGVLGPVYRRLSVLRGRLADLLGSAAYGRYKDDFVSVTLTDPSRPEGAMDSLRARFPHVLVLAFEPEGVVPDQRGYRARTAGRDDLSVAAEFVRHVSNAPPTAAEEQLLASAFAAVRTEEAAG